MVACGKKSKTSSAQVNETETSASPRTDSSNETVDNSQEDWSSVDDSQAYPVPSYNQIYTPTCSDKLLNFSLEKLQEFFFLTFPNANGNLNYCLSLPANNMSESVLRLEYQHSYSQNPNTLYITRYTTKTEYLLHTSYSGGVLKLIWMNKDGFIFVKGTQSTVTATAPFSGDVRYTNMPSSTDALMASDNTEAACLSGAIAPHTCAKNYVLHRSFFNNLNDATVSVDAKNRIKQILDYYYFNSYPNEFSNLGIYSQTLGNGMSFVFGAKQF
jgi:hypothetical protein